MKNINYEKYWLDEIKAHKYTIENNIKLRDMNTKLIEVNDKLIKSIQVLSSDKEILMKEIIRLQKVLKGEDIDKGRD